MFSFVERFAHIPKSMQILFAYSQFCTIISSIIVLATWRKNDVNLSLYSTLVLAISSFLLMISIIYVSFKTKNYWYLIQAICYGVVFVSSLILIINLNKIEGMSTEEIEDNMKHNTSLTNFYYISSLIPLCLMFVFVIYEKLKDRMNSITLQNATV